MQVSSRFTAAVHTLLCIDYFKDNYKVTSEFIASSTGVNAVIIRKILLQLQKAKLVETTAGVGGSRIVSPLNKITLLDVYKAVNEENEDNIFNFHPNPNSNCPVGKNIHKVLDPCLAAANNALEDELAKNNLENMKTILLSQDF